MPPLTRFSCIGSVRLILMLCLMAMATLHAATPYDIGTPTVLDLYVSPAGDDLHDGLSASSPLRTLTAAWSRIPETDPLSDTGYRINFLPGTYSCEPEEPDNCQNFFADRHGTHQFPIILQGMEGPGTVTLRGGLDLARISYLYLIDLTLAGGGDLPTNASYNNLLHLASMDHLLLRRVNLDGPDCASDACTNLQEVLKANQSQHLYIEQCELGGAWHTGIDYFAVQYGHVINTRIHTAGQWCMYTKGGTAYLLVEGNEFHDAQLGFGAGQSANMPMMLAPWLHYDVYDVKLVNNVMHDIPGVGFCARGAYNVLFAYNTLVNVGIDNSNGSPLLEVLPAERGCNATDELPDPLPICQSMTSQGAMGPSILTENIESIPNKNVYIYNNVFCNMAPLQTLYTHFSVRGPIPRPAGFQNLPDSITSDDNLVIEGNVVWNGPVDHPLGLDVDTGCQSSNPTCNASQIVAENAINVLEPDFVDAPADDYRPVPAGRLAGRAAVAIPDFTWTAFSPAVPVGTVSNSVDRDRAGVVRDGPGIPGAYTVVAPSDTSAFVVR